MPLLHIAGVTGTNKSFSAAFCFLAEETQPYYEWALKSLITILNANNIPLPKVVVTDHKQALINSLSNLIPSAKHLLCTWHIQKNLVTNTAKMIKNKEQETKMIKNWGNLI
jgi:histone-lysine N-methyltransferase SETD2